MTAPATPVEISPGLFVPTCLAHERPWFGAPSHDPSTAATNSAIHNSDRHGRAS